MERAQGIEGGEGGDTDIGEDCHPQCGKSTGCKQQDSKFDANSEPNILSGNAQGAACNGS